ncbi:hypothetical protein [Solidesulfovibrio sp. C21]|uniref:hypothetical protein n=1 Tax=Solidesulfovibrio sp. C21 TaxID=3398613 RepID=UPI0039FCD405
MEPEVKDATFSEELSQMEWEPLMPIEKKLIAWSISLGVVLLFVLYFVSAEFFPGAHG